MDPSFSSIVLFLITTAVYFAYICPNVTLSAGDKFDFADYTVKLPSGLGMYFVLTVVVQLLLNIAYLAQKCGFNSGKNILPALLFTVIPWTFIFGALMALLFVYPSLKSAFSNVIGYMVIAGSADKLLNKLLMGSEIILYNTGILVNQLNLSNFECIWQELKTKLKPGTDVSEGKTKLLELVAQKELIGEAVWYVYTAIFVSSIVSYNLASRGCVKDVATMKKERDDYIEEKEAKLEQAKTANKTVYKNTM